MAQIVQNSDTICLPHVVIAELRFGFQLGSRLIENEQLLNRFMANKKVRVLLPDNATTDYFVNLAVLARRKGVQLSSHDLWIAALAEQWEATLVSFDHDFRHLNYENLKLSTC